MIDRNKFLLLFSNEDSLEKLKQIMRLRFSLDKISTDTEEIKHSIKCLLDELNNVQEGFATGDPVKNAYAICSLMLEGR
ncbi:hypothetical protein RCG19_10425 [Neobacillus sp. OS1-2]|uniref:hypothetical protein n=1 Tax=Neobacillus sp. OS1-2 TaxID=3070680 RepID=UPI0027DEE36E|nr:hypothetical protein [Neobacillus sp. OS1-2]WML41997.1 hypothetical protein RCG19_10425 [Neobacillus sp. OS1-2]